jgi:aconitate hydratase
MELPVLVSAGDDVSTDEIMPAGAEALSLWSSLDGMSSHTFSRLDDSYTDRARDTGPHAVVGGRNYGQGSSREQAALAARHLGPHLVLAQSIARIHRANLVNYGVLPLTFADPADRARVQRDSLLRVSGLHAALRDGSGEVTVECGGDPFTSRHDLSPRQTDVLMAEGAIAWMRRRRSGGR